MKGDLMADLKSFSGDDLIFDEAETKTILKFFFVMKTDQIDGMTVTDDVRSFEQGLLVEAVDRSYEMGFVEALFRATANPADGPRKVIEKFLKAAAKNWFEYAKSDDLIHAKIYEYIRRTLALHYRTQLEMYLRGIAGVIDANKDARYKIAMQTTGMPPC